MKKKNLKSLNLHKRSISKLENVKGGLVTLPLLTILDDAVTISCGDLECGFGWSAICW